MRQMMDSLGHWIIILAVIGSATYLAAVRVIPGDAITTVYGVALGFTGGAVVARQRPRSPSTDGG